MITITVKNELPRLESGKLASFVWPGGYPLYYVTQDGGVLCPGCAKTAELEGLTNNPDDPQWYIVAAQANWEDEELTCDHCNEKIESAYGKDLSGDDKET